MLMHLQVARMVRRVIEMNAFAMVASGPVNEVDY